MNKSLSDKELKHRSKMEKLEHAMRSQNADDKLEVEHYFGHESYARVCFISKGAVLTGKIHRYSCINLIMQGDITVETAEGQKRIKAPVVFVSPPGVKRAGYAHEDTIWVNLHSTKQTDPELVEDEIIAKDFVDYDEGKAITHEPAGLTPCEEDVFRRLVLKKFSGKENEVEIIRMLTALK